MLYVCVPSVCSFSIFNVVHFFVFSFLGCKRWYPGDAFPIQTLFWRPRASLYLLVPLRSTKVRSTLIRAAAPGIMDPYPTPLCFQPNHVSPPLPSSSSVLPTFPYPPAVSVPAQRVKRNIFRQSHAGTNPTIIKDGNSPSAEQCTAVAILQGIPDCTILAWLEGFRSLPRGEQWFDPHHLSHQQRQAVSALKDCTDNLVLTWLTFAPSPRQSPHCSYRPWLIVVIGALNASQNLHGNGNFSSDRLAANSLDQSPSSFSDLSRDAYVGKQSSPPTTSNCHHHWCFVCEDPRPITTCDGFKRHIREHEKRYYCVPRESVVVTEDVPRCAFCHDVSNPDLKHLNTHSVPECIGRKYTRKKTHQTPREESRRRRWLGTGRPMRIYS